MNTQRGFSLLEILLALAVMAAIGVMAFFLLPQVKSSQDSTTTSQILTSALGNIRTSFPQKNYSNLNTTMAAGADFFPEEMTDSGLIYSNWEGAVEVCGADGSGQCVTAGQIARMVRFDYEAMPRRVCKKLTANVKDAFDRMEVAGLIVMNKRAGMEFDESLMVTACNSAETVDVVFVAF